MKRIGILTVVFLLLLAGVSFAAQRSYEGIAMQRTEMPKVKIGATAELKTGASRSVGLPAAGLKTGISRPVAATGGLRTGFAVAPKVVETKAAIAPRSVSVTGVRSGAPKIAAPQVTTRANPRLAAPKAAGITAAPQPKAGGIKFPGIGGGFKFPSAPKFK